MCVVFGSGVVIMVMWGGQRFRCVVISGVRWLGV